MQWPQSHVDWHEVNDEANDAPAESMRHRLPWLLGLFAIALTAVFGRAVQLELSDGAAFRDLATRPLARTRELDADRGRILARDGTPLAIDRRARGLAIHYRYLENPPDAGWLRRQARARLTRTERRDPSRMAAMQDVVRDELGDLHLRLARWCQVPPVQWRERAARVQLRVEALAALVDSRRQERFVAEQALEEEQADSGAWRLLTGLFSPPEPLAPQGVLLAEHEAYHRLVDDLPEEVVAEIEQHAQQYPGVRVVEYRQRSYPQGSLAAHLVGHVSSQPRVERQDPLSVDAANSLQGLQGIERHYEASLRGRRGIETRSVDHRGRLLAAKVEQAPVAGRDVVLTLDAPLQTAAEQLLQRAIRRLDRQQRNDADEERSQQSSAEGVHCKGDTLGGAIVVLDVHSGEVLAAASAPSFDPNWFATGDARLESVLNDPRRPMFDRATRMAIPPGSVFKALTAVALAERGVVDPQTPFRCQGYLDDPARLRCQLFRQHGIGHGDVTLADALAQSCNVYFFHHAEAVGGAAMLETARQFGFAAPTGIALADEASGQLPSVEELRSLEQVRYLTVGQGGITATPLQVVRFYAALANGGYLVESRLTLERQAEKATGRAPASAEVRGRKVEGISPATLAVVREGLQRVVADSLGTAYNTVRLPSIAIAGKTGTAETTPEQGDHAWFAGYAPSDAPQVAFAVVLEHGGSGAAVAGPVAKSLVQAMQHLGYFGEAPVATRPPQRR